MMKGEQKISGWLLAVSGALNTVCWIRGSISTLLKQGHPNTARLRALFEGSIVMPCFGSSALSSYQEAKICLK